VNRANIKQLKTGAKVKIILYNVISVLETDMNCCLTTKSQKSNTNLLFICINYEVYFISCFQLYISFNILRCISQVKYFL